jgi:hypothetical protein
VSTCPICPRLWVQSPASQKKEKKGKEKGRGKKRKGKERGKEKKKERRGKGKGKEKKTKLYQYNSGHTPGIHYLYIHFSPVQGAKETQNF